MSIIKEDPIEGIYVHRKQAPFGVNLKPYEDHIIIEMFNNYHGNLQREAISLSFDEALEISFELSSLAHKAHLDHLNKVREWEQKQREKENNS